MNAVYFNTRGGPEALVYGPATMPAPGEGEIVVRVHAAGVIQTELSWIPTWTTRAGEPRSFPVIPGHEFSGEIAALGTGARDVSVGDFVYGLNDWYRDGASAEYCVARVADIAPKPAGVDHISAAATPISALTVWQGLFERAGLAAGQQVLIHGAAGGVGTFAVQLARWRGARVTGTASAANLDFVRSLGADEVIDYRAERFEDLVPDMDVVFDTVGGETLERSWGVLKPGGRLVTVAASGEQTTDERIRAAYFIVEPSRTQLMEIARLIDEGALRPVIGAVFPLAEARQAYQYKPVRGKVVLRVVDGEVAT
ncbi:MAG: NADP-dependent oxidoreductase [Nitrospirota bacterium]|jgi:NADPH:quinone reductase-like Zn-dependent oxidoreductase